MSPDTSTYAVTVQGHLDPHWAGWLDDVSLTHQADGTSTLVTSLADQAALHGLLARVRDLGVTLIAVMPAAAPPAQSLHPPSLHHPPRHTDKEQPMSATLTPLSPATSELPPVRLHLMRGGYLLMGLGLAVVKWPLLVDIATMPLHEGITLCLLTAMSVLALVGLWHPLRMLPVLVFESLWKLLWLGLVALPHALDGTMDAAMTEVAVNCSLVVVILAVIPWRHVRTAYVRSARTPGR